MQSTEEYDAIISANHLDIIYHKVMKNSRRGCSWRDQLSSHKSPCFTWYVERIPTIKDSVKRFKSDIAFKMDYGSLVSGNVPSEASYSRLIDKQHGNECVRSVLRKKSSNRLFKKDLTQTIRSLSIQYILKVVTRIHSNRKKESQPRRNASENPKLNDNNGFKNKLKKKRMVLPLDYPLSLTKPTL